VALKLDDKKAIVDEVAQVAKSALSLVAAEYRGLSVAKMTELRSKARQTGVFLKVVRNTLARRALEGTDFACAREALSGPLVLAFSQEDPGAAARLIRDFIKTNDSFKVRAISIEKQLLGVGDLERVAKLPTRNEALSMLLGVIKAPLNKLAGTLDAPGTKLVRTLVAVQEQKAAS
jgi:large subunit ribosomal protein L10